MSNPKIGKGRNEKGRQTVMGDFFSKSNKTKKSVKSKGQGEGGEKGTKVTQTKTETTIKKKKGEPARKQTSKAVEKKPVVQKQETSIAVEKKQDQAVDKKPEQAVLKKQGQVVDKKPVQAVEKKPGQAIEKKPIQPVEKRTSLKRKVTGAGMFTFSWTRGAQKDTEQYRDGYPGKLDYPDQDDNYRFYMNQLSSKPDGDFIDKIHIDWWGDYRLLEVHHGYIQWLFPIRESGLNWHAQELQLHEIRKIQRSKNAMKRILTSYKMMLDFYGMKLESEEDGTIVRAENWRDRFRHLNRSYHNYLRITRILKCLGEFGYEHLKKNFVKFILYEGIEKGTLSNLIDSCVKYWIGVLKEENEREEVFDYYEKLSEDDSCGMNCSKRRNRSPSPPSYSSYLLDSDSESKTGKRVISKKGKEGTADNRDRKDEIDGDDTKAGSEDDEDGTLFYAMSLIEDDMPDETDKKKDGKRKDHEMSDSDESQEMAHWKKESNKVRGEEDLEGGSECYDSSNDNNVEDSVDKENAEELKVKNENDKQKVKNEFDLDEQSTALNEETKQDADKKVEEKNKVDGTENEGNDKNTEEIHVNKHVDNNSNEDISRVNRDGTENEGNDKNTEEIHGNEQGDNNSNEGISRVNRDTETAKENTVTSEDKQEEMDTCETQNDNNQVSSIGDGNVEEGIVKSEDVSSIKSVNEPNETKEENMETQ